MTEEEDPGVIMTPATRSSNFTGALRDRILEVVTKTMKAMDPAGLVREQVTLVDDGIMVGGVPLRTQNGGGAGSFILVRERSLRGQAKIHALGAGKAAPFILEGLLDVLGNRIHGGVVVTTREQMLRLMRGKDGAVPEYQDRDGSRTERTDTWYSDPGQGRENCMMTERGTVSTACGVLHPTGALHGENTGGNQTGSRLGGGDTAPGNLFFPGLPCTPDRCPGPLEWNMGPVRIIAGSHPIPDAWSERAGTSMVEYIEREIGEADLVFFLVSGGASSLMEVPRSPHTMEEISAATERLLLSGTDIHRMNSQRKQWSALKGGGLAKLIHPARVVTLGIADIPRDRDREVRLYGNGGRKHRGGRVGSSRCCDDVAVLRDLGSGPTITEGQDSGSVMNGRVVAGETGDLALVLGDNARFLDTLKDILRQDGFECTIVSVNDSGDVREAAREHARLIRGHWRSRKYGGGEGYEPMRGAQIFLSGGELTVKVTGRGKGGRNQEFVLALLKELGDAGEKYPEPFLVVAIASDGIDGPTDAAGAWVDHTTLNQAMELGLQPDEFLADNDSYRFFGELDHLIRTGPTRTNVMDVRIIVI